MDILLTLILFFNSISFIIFGIDKLLAIKAKRRISERILIFFSSFAPFGSIMGMVIFNHKTSKIKFRFFVPMSVSIHCFVFYYIFSNNLL